MWAAAVVKTAAVCSSVFFPEGGGEDDDDTEDFETAYEHEHRTKPFHMHRQACPRQALPDAGLKLGADVADAAERYLHRVGRIDPAHEQAGGRDKADGEEEGEKGEAFCPPAKKPGTHYVIVLAKNDYGIYCSPFTAFTAE